MPNTQGAQGGGQVNPGRGQGSKPQVSLEVTDEDVQAVEKQLEYVERVLEGLAGNEEGVTYGDTGTSMQVIDNILGANPSYKQLKEKRKEASIKIMQGDEQERQEGLKQAKEWAKEVRELL